MQRWLTSTWSQAQMIASATSVGMVWTRRLAIAAAFFTITMPRMNSGTSLTVVPEMGKFSTARRVWMP